MMKQRNSKKPKSSMKVSIFVLSFHCEMPPLPPGGSVSATGVGDYGFNLWPHHLQIITSM